MPYRITRVAEFKETLEIVAHAAQLRINELDEKDGLMEIEATILLRDAIHALVGEVSQDATLTGTQVSYAARFLRIGGHKLSSFAE